MKQYKIIKTRKILKTFKNHREKMSIFINVWMSKIMHTPIKAGVCTYVDMHQLSNPDQKQISGDGKVCQIQNIEII